MPEGATISVYLSAPRVTCRKARAGFSLSGRGTATRNEYCVPEAPQEHEITDCDFKWGGLRRAMPYAFTEQGVATLSSVLHSKRAVLEKFT